MIEIITPNWSAPSNVVAFTTTRLGGISPAPYTSLNLGINTQDSDSHIAQNVQQLCQQFNLPETPNWLAQVHKADVIEITEHYQRQQADASFTRQPHKICTVLTADCLPILICNQQGTEIAAIHAGWRSLAQGVIENTLARLESPANELIAWLGPAISADVYEVGKDVKAAFVDQYPEDKNAFTPNAHGKYLMDLKQLATRRLKRAGVNAITHSEHCTFSDPETFYSYRRDGETGRIATLIYFTQP